MTAISEQTRIAVIGGGKMGSAIVGGLIASEKSPADVLQAANFIVANPGEERRNYLQKTYGVATVQNASEIASADIIFLAVKPQIMAGVLDEIAASALGAQVASTNPPLFVSIAAGISRETIAQHLPDDARIVRAMPNMPLLIGKGATAVCGDERQPEDTQLVEALFDCLGVSGIVTEPELDAVTAVSGSGPAYVCAFIEAMRDGGIEEGLPSELSETLALCTVLGTAEYILETGIPVHEVLESICSPGGTTLAGLSAMEEAEFSASVRLGEQAAAKRSRELGAQ